MKTAFAYILLIALLMVGCTDRIDISTRDAEPRLVIYGGITSEAAEHVIRITRSTGYFSDSSPEGISGAQVTISQGQNTIILTEKASEPGSYVTEANVRGIPGRTYTLSVTVDFNGDGRQTHYTSTSMMPIPALVHSIRLQPSTLIEDHIEVLLFATLPAMGKNNFNLRVWKNSTPLSDSLQQFSIMDDDNLASNELKGVPCAYLDQAEPLSKLAPGDIVTIVAEAITEDYADFLKNAQSEARGSIPFFGGPPANIPSNIHPTDPNDKTPISGFFAAYSVDTGSAKFE